MTPLAKRLAIGLLISIALNLLCAGFLLGRGLRGGRGRQGPARSLEDGQALRHPALRRAYEAERGHVKGRRDAVRQARARVSEALRIEPFQPARLEQSLAELRSETTKTQELVHRALVKAAREGTPEARSELSRGFERPARRRR
ncbi:MAG TPA: periplasmic heavy metal sensor [Polyangiaceae bacterium]